MSHGKNHGYAEIRPSSGKKYYTRTIAENGEILGHAEALNSRKAAINNILAELNLYNRTKVKVKDYSTGDAENPNVFTLNYDGTIEDFKEIVVTSE